MDLIEKYAFQNKIRLFKGNIDKTDIKFYDLNSLLKFDLNKTMIIINK